LVPVVAVIVIVPLYKLATVNVATPEEVGKTVVPSRVPVEVKVIEATSVQTPKDCSNVVTVTVKSTFAEILEELVAIVKLVSASASIFKVEVYPDIIFVQLASII
jgi:hypothetical protein